MRRPFIIPKWGGTEANVPENQSEHPSWENSRNKFTTHAKRPRKNIFVWHSVHALIYYNTKKSLQGVPTFFIQRHFDPFLITPHLCVIVHPNDYLKKCLCAFLQKSFYLITNFFIHNCFYPLKKLWKVLSWRTGMCARRVRWHFSHMSWILLKRKLVAFPSNLPFCCNKKTLVPFPWRKQQPFDTHFTGNFFGTWISGVSPISSGRWLEAFSSLYEQKGQR